MQLSGAIKLLAESRELSPELRWDLPFPMGVFGTLRKGRGNAYRMERGHIGGHFKAFMPHFIAHGLSITFKQGASAPFEIYAYTPENWKKMIPGVDALEGFSPAYATRNRQYHFGYYRTLAWLHVLPDAFSHNLFDEGRRLDATRDLELPVDEWSQYERVPCWVYSNIHGNAASREADVDTVIWG